MLKGVKTGFVHSFRKPIVGESHDKALIVIEFHPAGKQHLQFIFAFSSATERFTF
jgi:hypothetical protein